MYNKNRSISDVVGELLGLDPTVKYRASMLPLVRTADDKVEFGVPSMLADLVGAFMLPGHVAQGGSYTPKDVTNMAMNVGMMGAPVGYATAPKGALAMSGAGKKEPLIAYHGSYADVNNPNFKFDLSKQVNGRTYGKGVYFDTNINRAKGYGPNIMKAELDLQKPLNFRSVLPAEDINRIKELLPLDTDPYSMSKVKISTFNDAELTRAFFEKQNEIFKTYGKGYDRYTPFIKEGTNGGYAVSYSDPDIENMIGADILYNLRSFYPSSFDNILRDVGFDGVNTGNEIVVFDPSKIKPIR